MGANARRRAEQRRPSPAVAEQAKTIGIAARDAGRKLGAPCGSVARSLQFRCPTTDTCTTGMISTWCRIAEECPRTERGDFR